MDVTPRAFLACLIFLPFLLACGGCASSHPRVTVFAECDRAETTGGEPRQRTATHKYGASLTCELP